MEDDIVLSFPSKAWFPCLKFFLQTRFPISYVLDLNAISFSWLRSLLISQLAF